MKYLLTIISCLLALNFTAQEVVVEYPYNPDFENDGNVGVEDLLQLLSSFGMAFEVGELTIDEVVLSEWLQTISETLIAQQAIIDSLSSLVPVLDSAIVADFLNNASGAAGQTSKSLSFPEGLEGTIVTFEVGPSISYLVEEGKNLYVTDWYGFEPTIDGMPMFTASQSLPLIVAGGRELSNIDDSGNSYGIGILTEATEEVEIIYGSVDLDNPFIVEEGKRLYVTNGWDGGGEAVIQDPEGNTYYISNPPDAIPCIVPSGYSFSSPYNLFESTFSGYLVDEDYFESSSPSVVPEAESLGLAFGERVHLGEPEDWGPLPWDDYVNYGTYAFDDQGIFMGYMKGPFYNIYVLNDSIEMEDISSSELETHSVVEITNGPDAFSIIVGTNERVIVRGMPNSFEYPETERNFDWIPVQSSNTISTGNESEDQSQASVGNASLGSSCRCWPDQGEIIVELPEADFVYLDVEPYLTGSQSSQYDSYNCFKFKLPDGPGFTTMTIIPPHIFNITPPVGSEGDELDALQFEVYSSNFIGHLQYDGGIDNWSWGPHAGWHAWRFIRDHNGNWRPQTTQP